MNRAHARMSFSSRGKREKLCDQNSRTQPQDICHGSKELRRILVPDTPFQIQSRLLVEVSTVGHSIQRSHSIHSPHTYAYPTYIHSCTHIHTQYKLMWLSHIDTPTYHTAFNHILTCSLTHSTGILNSTLHIHTHINTSTHTQTTTTCKYTYINTQTLPFLYQHPQLILKLSHPLLYPELLVQIRSAQKSSSLYNSTISGLAEGWIPSLKILGTRKQVWCLSLQSSFKVHGEAPHYYDPPCSWAVTEMCSSFFPSSHSLTIFPDCHLVYAWSSADLDSSLASASSFFSLTSNLQ